MTSFDEWGLPKQRKWVCVSRQHEKKGPQNTNICLDIRSEKFHNSDFDFDLMKIEMKIAVDIASCC